MSSLIYGLLENLPHRLTIDKALTHLWLNPSKEEQDVAALFHQLLKNDVDQNDDDGDNRKQELDEQLVSHTICDENQM